jgi:serine/threonine protein kinase
VSVSVGDTIDRYRIEEKLADGDIVMVFRAVSEEDGQRVALKIVHQGIDDAEVLRRFEREARIAQRVEHPNLITVLDTGRAGGVPYMTMRYVQGRTVAQILEEDGPLPLDSVVRVIEQAGGGLDALHREGIVHRDVRSSNVLVDLAGTAALTDFGFARSSADTRITELHRPVGTLDYRAPELFLGKSAERSSDIYSLGCVAYECVVGSPPFADHREWTEVGRAHIEDDPPDPGARRQDVPPEFVSAVLTALDKNPGRRPPSAAAYARLLRFGLPG